MLRPSIVRAIGAFLLMAGHLPCPAQETCLTIGIGTGGAYAEERPALVEAIFSKAGLCAKPLLVPLSRLDRMEDKGELDGNAWHDDSYLATHSEMAKVPTPVEHFRGSLFWLRGHQESRVVRAVPLYLVVQNRYKNLIPALDKAIKAMRSSGAIQD